MSLIGQQKTFCLFLPPSRWESGTARLVQQSENNVCCSKRGRRVSSLPEKFCTSAGQGPPWLSRCRPRSPQSVKPRAGSEPFCRVGSLRGKRDSCTASREALDGNLYEVRKDKVLCCQESHLWNPACPKVGNPSQSQQDPLTIISGHLGTWLPTQQTSAPYHQIGPRPGSKVHISYTSWQALGNTKLHVRPWGERKAAVCAPWHPSLQWGHIPDPGIVCNKLVN